MKHALVLPLIALAMAGCGSSHQTVNPPMPGTVPSTPADMAIARIQANEGFRFFPNSQTRIGCVIPGPVSNRIKGTCQTRVSHEVRPRGSVTIVTFTEYWPARKFRTPHAPRTGLLQHSWAFEIRPGGRIVSGGSNGNFPPQSAI